MITQYAWNKPASWPLNIRLSAAKTRFTQSKFIMLQVLHCVVLVTFAREKKRKRNHCSSRLSRSSFTLSRAYESCLACQRLFLTESEIFVACCSFTAHSVKRHQCNSHGGTPDFKFRFKWWGLVVSSLRSKCFRASSSRTSGREQKNKGMTGEGEGEGKKGTACPQTPRFWKTAFGHERSFWLVRCW